MKKIDLFSIIGSVASIISLIVTIYLFLRVQTISEWIDDKVDPLDLSIKIIEPKDQDTVTSHVILIKGFIEFGCKSLKSSRIGTELQKREISIYPIINPISQSSKWYLQTPCLVDDNGNFSGTVMLGDSDNGIGIDYLVKIIAVKKNQMKENKDILGSAPIASSSEILTIKRINKIEK
jgi:hypothetical protein